MKTTWKKITLGNHKFSSNNSILIGNIGKKMFASKHTQAFVFCRHLIFNHRSICASETEIDITQLMQRFSESYLAVCEEQKHTKKLKDSKKEEFFGLRDFYRYGLVFWYHFYPAEP